MQFWFSRVVIWGIKMRKEDNDKCVFPLTSLQIGDLQSYLSELSLFPATESNRLYMLVDNRPWLRDLGPAHLWQLMVTKSRLSPFAISKIQKGKKEEEKETLPPNPSRSKKLEKWYSLIDAANLSRKRGLPPVKNLRHSLLLGGQVQRTLYGFIVFEITWSNVRGINYLNELLTDTSMAIEAKFMRRWEFDSIAQASSCISSWFSGSPSELLFLKNYLDSITGDVFYDAEENFAKTHSRCNDEDICSDDIWAEDNSSCCFHSNFSVYPGTTVNTASNAQTPPLIGPYKRRRVTKSNDIGEETDLPSEDIESKREGSLGKTSSCTADCEVTIESKQYRDVLVLFRFNDRDLPFKLRQIIMSDLRLLTLLEAGLPSWVIFLQSYPGFCHLYRPWMCPLARALYVLMSIVTVLIGFYDLYKNVPVLKATASRLCGPLFDWIETWEMVSRIKYLGTMLFLHHFQKAVSWFLTVTRTTKSFFSVFMQPLAAPFLEIVEFLLPTWNVLIGVSRGLCSAVWVVVESSFAAVGDLIQIIVWPIWLVVSLTWKIVTSIVYPIVWMIGEIIYAPIRIVLTLSSSVGLAWVWISELIRDIWQSVSSVVKVASASQATVRGTYEVSMWRSLWNDLFSQVFRAVRSILNGFVAFFTAYNRHRLSIYNHLQDFIRRILGQPPRSPPADSRNRRTLHRSHSVPELNKRVHIRKTL